MIALAIVGALLGILLIILLCPVGVGLFYHEDLVIKLYFGAFNKKVYPSRKKNSGKIDSPNKKKKTAKDKKKKPKPSFDDILKIAECLLISLRKLILSLRIKKLYAKVIVSDDDAATAALNYGKVCSAVSMVYASLDKVLNEKNTDVSVDLQYDGESKAEVDFVINAMLLKIIIIAIKALIVIMPLLSDNKKGGAKNERN